MLAERSYSRNIFRFILYDLLNLNFIFYNWSSVNAIISFYGLSCNLLNLVIILHSLEADPLYEYVSVFDMVNLELVSWSLDIPH